MDYTLIRKNFEKHGFATRLFAKGEEVRDYFVQTLQGQSIGFGGSVTLRQLGLFEALSENNAVAWHNHISGFRSAAHGETAGDKLPLTEQHRGQPAMDAHTGAAAVPGMAVRRLANQARIYITSVNAVSESGVIVNIDGTGNRLAMSAFGPETCYYVVGKNKLTASLGEALHRAKNVAGPLNAKRLGAKTPCAAKGDKCYDCDSPGRICRMTMLTERAPLGMQSEIIFVDEELGL